MRYVKGAKRVLKGDTNMSNIRKLFDICNMATPGPWKVEPCRCGDRPCRSVDVGPRDSRGGYSPDDAAFIAIASPQLVYALLELYGQVAGSNCCDRDGEMTEDTKAALAAVEEALGG